MQTAPVQPVPRLPDGSFPPGLLEAARRLLEWTAEAYAKELARAQAAAAEQR